MKKEIGLFPWHTLLFSVFPVLSLMAANTGQIDNSVSTRSFAISLSVSIILLLVTKWFLSDWQKAGVLITVWSFLFYSYGHVHSFINNMEIAGIVIGRHRVLGSVWLVLILISTWWAVSRNHKALTSSLNLATAFLLIFPTYTLTSFWISNMYFQSTGLNMKPSDDLTNLYVSEDSPDVYFIVLDQYARSDVLAQYFNYDNSAFINRLRELGFYIASCSRSNYPYTTPSLAATLNLDYVSDLGDEFGYQKTQTVLMEQIIKHNRVEEIFRQLGYKTIAFETGYDFTELEDVDIFYELSSNKINNFEALLLRNSATILLSDLGLLDQFYLTDDERKRERINFVLDQLEKISSIPGKKFVFVHLVIPHPPFVFGPNGESLIIQPYYENGEMGYKKDDFRAGYHNQVIFISSRIIDTIENIISKSSSTPVVIIQGDHGPITIPDNERFNILSAYLFPDSKIKLYPTLTPVNNFRIIFNMYFNGSFPLISDKSFTKDIFRPYIFEGLSSSQDMCAFSE